MSKSSNKPYMEMTPQEKLAAFKKQGRLEIIEVEHHSKSNKSGRGSNSNRNSEIEHGRD